MYQKRHYRDRCPTCGVPRRENPANFDPSRFLAIRQARNLNQRGMARLLGTSQQHVSWLETARFYPSEETFETMCAKLEVEPGALQFPLDERAGA